MEIKEVIVQRWQIILICIFAILVTFYCQGAALFNKYAFIEDLRRNIYWMERARNPDMFRGDLIADFSEFFASPLLKWLYKIAFFIDVQLFAKLLSFPLCLFSAVYMYNLGNKIAGKYCGLFTGLLFVITAWYPSSFDFFGIGNAGDFFPFLGTAFLYYFFTDNMAAMASILILQAFIYPPIFLISLICFVSSVSYSINFKRILLLFFIIIAAFLILFNNRKIQIHKFGEAFSIQEIKNMEEFKEGGRIPLIYPTLFKRIFNNRDGIGHLWGRLGILLYLTLICSLLYIKKIKNLFPYKIVIFLFSSTLLFILANIFMLKFFQPSRYMLLSLPIVLITIISIYLSKIINFFNSENKKIFFSVFMVILILLLFFKKIKPAYMLVENIKFFNSLECLPNNALMAGHPDVMDNVPLIAKKKVFLSSEECVPYFKKYYTEMQNRTYDFFNAYYSDSFNTILDFCKENNIDYFVVRKNDFSDKYLAKGEFYYLPFNDFIKRLIEKQRKFALAEIPSSIVSYEDQEYVVIKIDK